MGGGGAGGGDEKAGRRRRGRDGAGTPPTEIELKLALSAEAMEVIAASPLLREHARGPVREAELLGVYYDTPDRRLRARSASLRVRRDGADGRWVQTLKTARDPDAAHARRVEWEAEVDGPRPRPEAFADPAALDVLGLLPPEELEPVFETRVRRRALAVGWASPGGVAPAVIEAAFDEGAVVAGDRELPLRELELELVEGEPAALFSLAEALRETAPLRIEPLDKSTRGWLLATGMPPPVRKAVRLELGRDDRVDDALAAVLSSVIGHWLANEPAAAEGRDPEGVHQLRIALRRLRSAFSLFAMALGDGPRERWLGEVRWLLHRLGPARDLDVLTNGLLAPLLDARGDDPAVQAFRDAAERRRRDAYGEVREALLSPRYADLVLGLAAWGARRGWREGADVDLRLRQHEPAAAFAAGVLERRRRKVLKRGRRFERLLPAERHRVRIALKKLRYGIDFFGDLFPRKRVRRFGKAAARMQDRLGHLNDVAVARRLVGEIVDGLPPGAEAAAVALGGGQLVGWCAEQVTRLEAETVETWREFAALEPFWEGKG